MRKLLIFLLTLFCGFSKLQADHIISGSIGFECLGNDDYEITMIIFRDCGGDGALFDDPASMGIYKGDELFQSLEVSLNSFESINPEPYEDCPANFDSYCVEKGIYKVTVNLPLSALDSYSIVYQRCCWSESISNIVDPGEHGITIKTDITPLSQSLCNSYKVMDVQMAFAACPSVPVSIPFEQTDAEGDSLTFEFCFPLDGAGFIGGVGAPGDPTVCDGVIPTPPCGPPYEEVPIATGFDGQNPFPTENGITYDPDKGTIEFTPNLLGRFIYSMCISEYRNGELLGIYRNNIHLSSKIITSTSDLQGTKQWQVNYFSSEQAIRMTNQQAEPAEIFLFDQNGIKLARLEDQSYEANFSTIKWTAGVYFILIAQKQRSEIHKVFIF